MNSSNRKELSLSERDPLFGIELTALIPDSCCENCITMAMTSGSRSVGDRISSHMVILTSDFCAHSSARISSMSSSMSTELRSFFSAAEQKLAMKSKLAKTAPSALQEFRVVKQSQRLTREIPYQVGVLGRDKDISINQFI